MGRVNRRDKRRAAKRAEGQGSSSWSEQSRPPKIAGASPPDGNSHREGILSSPRTDFTGESAQGGLKATACPKNSSSKRSDRRRAQKGEEFRKEEFREGAKKLPKRPHEDFQMADAMVRGNWAVATEGRLRLVCRLVEIGESKDAPPNFCVGALNALTKIDEYVLKQERAQQENNDANLTEKALEQMALDGLNKIRSQTKTQS